MTAIESDALFLLTGPEPERKRVFGTGFAVAQNQEQLFILTCAHVVEQLGDGRILASGADAVAHEAQLEAIGSSNAIDLALLRIPCGSDALPLLNRPAKGRPDMPFQVLGYSPHSGAKQNYVQRDIRGRLGKLISFKAVGIKSIEAWDIHVEDDDFSRLQGGYSGSPLCDDKGRLLAVVSHNADPAAGQRGHAIALSNLKSIYPEITQLMPAFADLTEEPLEPTARINQAMRQLADRVLEIHAVFPAAGLELERMRKEGINEEDEEILDEINGFVEGTLTPEAFIAFFTKLENRRKAAATGQDYKRFVEQLNSGQVILCLGQELSPLLGAGIPCTAELISRLAVQDNFSGPLSEICEQKEIAPDCCRADLVNELHGLFRSAEKSPPLPLYELLAGLKKPFIVISTAYDELLEQSLQGRRNFVVVCPNMEGKECLLRYSDGREIICTPEEISQHKPLENGYAVIYRLRGGIVGSRKHLLLSERDYFQFNRLMKQQFPDYIGSRLKTSLCSLWFLGHHPQSWEERLLIRFLKDFQDERASSFAVQETLSPFARSFWQQPNVRARVFELPLAEFVEELVKEAAA